MTLRSTTLLLVLLVLSKLIFAQSWNSRPYELYYGIGMSNFMGDIAAPSDPNKNIWIHFFNTVAPVANIGLRYQYHDRHHFKGSLYLGQFYAEDVPDDSDWHYRGYKMSSFFTELSVQYEYLIFKGKSRKTVYQQLGESRLKNFSVPTYLFIGLGGTFNAGTLTNLNGQSVDKENYTNISPAFPIGFGFKFRLSRYAYANLEAGLRLTFNDGLDNAKGSEDSSFGNYMDQYQFIAINIIHKIKANKKGLPRFRKKQNF